MASADFCTSTLLLITRITAPKTTDMASEKIDIDTSSSIKVVPRSVRPARRVALALRIRCRRVGRLSDEAAEAKIQAEASDAEKTPATAAETK